MSEFIKHRVPVTGLRQRGDDPRDLTLFIDPTESAQGSFPYQNITRTALLKRRQSVCAENVCTFMGSYKSGDQSTLEADLFDRCYRAFTAMVGNVVADCN